MTTSTQDIIYRGAIAAASTALVMGVGAAGMNYIGLAKKITGRTAPAFMDAAKYGLMRGVVTFGVTVFAGHVNKHFKSDANWSKLAINVGALAVFYFTVPHGAQFAKKHLNVSVHDRFQYLALFGEGINFYFLRM
ncbi:MAG: hypothetical protein KFB93_07060 [Simkaniaceae bacterium]|nr:MAG: hypothetical protein KFB93_07060 [Simkaniaceae bacterium]